MPTRATARAAGYDFAAAQDIIVPPYDMSNCAIYDFVREEGYLDNISDCSIFKFLAEHPFSLDEMNRITKITKAKPTLISTGMKCYLDPDKYLELSVRSSSPLKYWLMLANGVGIIDADYVDNKDNEGEIFFQVINFTPFAIQIKKGDKIGQGIIKSYYLTDDDCAKGVREGGFGSTNK